MDSFSEKDSAAGKIVYERFKKFSEEWRNQGYVKPTYSKNLFIDGLCFLDKAIPDHTHTPIDYDANTNSILFDTLMEDLDALHDYGAIHLIRCGFTVVHRVESVFVGPPAKNGLEYEDVYYLAKEL